MVGNEAPLKVGLATFAQPTFDVDWAEGVRTRTVQLLEGLGVELVVWDKPLMYEAEAYEFRKRLRKEDVDVVFLQSGGFSFGGLPVIIGTGVEVPCIIWSTPEPEFDGSVIRSNSLCAGIMNNCNLRHAGVNVQFLYGEPAPEMAGRLQSMLKALRAIKLLRQAKLGIIGHRAPGFYSSGFDEIRLQSDLGIEAFHVDLSTVLHRVEEISDEEADKVIAGLDVDMAESVKNNWAGLKKSVKVYLALKEIARDEHLDALAVKCWPEFPQEQKFSVCFSISLLNNDGVITACEADVYGAVSMLIQDLLGEGPEFFNDLIHIDMEVNHGVYWHCGAAAAVLSDQKERALVEPHGMRGTPAVISFPLKPGRVTISRLTLDNRKWKMFVAGGEAVKTPMLLRGNPSRVKLDAPVQKVLDTIIEQGFEHHYATIYSDIRAELRWFCRFLNIDYIQPE